MAAASAELWRYRSSEPITPSGITIIDLIVTTLTCDDGLTGFGFSVELGAGDEAALLAARGALERCVTGRPLRHPLAVWDELAGVLLHDGNDWGRTACASIDVAVWDLYARAEDVPIGIAMGGTPRRVPVYGSGGFKRGGDPAEAVAVALAHVRRGARGVKLRAEGTRADEALLAAVAAGMPGHAELMIDANGRCDLAGAQRLLRYAAAVNARFVEEPLPSTQPEAYAALARSAPVPVATGENLRGSAEAAPYLLGGWCRVMQPDVTVMGGLTECLRTAQLAEHAGIETAPHFLPGLFVQLAAVIPNLTWLEDFPTVEPLFSRIPLMEADGTMTLPSQPGHGLAFASGARDEFRIA